MEWLSQDFQGLHFDTQAINETSSSWALIPRGEGVAMCCLGCGLWGLW